MNGQGAKKRIIWSVNAFEDDPDMHHRIIDVLKPLTEKIAAEIEPVYVLSPDQVNVPTGMAQEGLAEYSTRARNDLRGLSRQFDLPGLLPPAILSHEGFSLTKSVKALIDHAVRTRADFIVVGSHGRSGLERILLGSFTETLLLYSPIPVLVVGLHFDHRAHFDHILFPTDLSDTSRVAFAQVMDFAQLVDAKITLFHFVPHPIEPLIQSGLVSLGGGWVSIPNYLSEVESGQKHQLEKWASPGRRKGIKIDTAITSDAMNTADAVMNFAKTSGIGLIAMAAESGAVASTVLGSVSRQVVRLSPWPVWILRPQSVKTNKKASQHIPDEMPMET
jgi:nucleotide-binding universal stress UspA family protein